MDKDSVVTVKMVKAATEYLQLQLGLLANFRSLLFNLRSQSSNHVRQPPFSTPLHPPQPLHPLLPLLSVYDDLDLIHS